MKELASTPMDVVKKLFDEFVPEDARSEKFFKALHDLVSRQSFDKDSRLEGPKLKLTILAKKAGLSRDLVGHENCELPKTRELIQETFKALSDYSFEVRCEYLTAEVKHLKTRLDKYDSIAANRVVALYKGTSRVEPTPRGKYTGAQVRASTRIVPMQELGD